MVWSLTSHALQAEWAMFKITHTLESSSREKSFCFHELTVVICMWYTMVSAYELQEEQVLGGSGSVFKIYLCLIFRKKKRSIIRRPWTRIRVFFPKQKQWKEDVCWNSTSVQAAVRGLQKEICSAAHDHPVFHRCWFFVLFISFW